jgi:hypothetical protein
VVDGWHQVYERLVNKKDLVVGIIVDGVSVVFG